MNFLGQFIGIQASFSLVFSYEIIYFGYLSKENCPDEAATKLRLL